LKLKDAKKVAKYGEAKKAKKQGLLSFFSQNSERAIHMQNT
jgi:hypothetical protein